MQNYTKGRFATGLALGLTAMMVTPLYAQDAGEIADGLAGQLGSFADLLSILAFVLGIGMAIAGFMKFRANSQNPNDPSNKLSTAFILIFVGAGLVAIPAVLGSGIATFFDDGAATTDANQGFRAL